jgi:arsenite-transporting ATPase
VRLGATTRRLAVRGDLRAAELDADRALACWLRTRRPVLGQIAERGTYLDRDDIGRFLGLALPGVDELIGLLELERLAHERPYDDVIVDTAPTGHTLRLLEMPETLRRIAVVLDDMQAKHRFVATSLGGAYRADSADRLVDELDTSGKTLAELLRDPTRASFAWVLLPERLALEEARDGIGRLDAWGIRVDDIVVNRLTSHAVCPLCQARAEAERRVIDDIVAAFPDRVVRFLPAEDEEPRGITALRRIGRRLAAGATRRPIPRHRPRARRAARRPSGRSDWLDRIAPRAVRLVLVGGKGGVGKTTCAAALALALARRDPDRRVLLLSTDPAHSLGDVLAARLGDDEAAVPGAPANFRARELDADSAFRVRRERYRDAVDRAFTSVLRGTALDVTFDRAVVRELLDLAPPGLDELFGTLAIVDALFRPAAPSDVVVVDTAPTGHTLRLLRMPATALEWVRTLLATVLKYRAVIGLGDFAAELVEVSRDLRRLDDLLHDSAVTRFVPVTRPAELPRRETVRLLQGLRRLRVTAPALIVNAVASTEGRETCARCARAARAAGREIAALARTLPGRGRAAPTPLVTAAAVTPPPIGVDRLAAWSRTWHAGVSRS